ncbi:spore coat protein U domain-containing protein [Ramlibacter sp.]|uniref:spore coat protein U domain-containing protein n=1 Tax=Ramlibacter sp. TaxID=1917967 RepID=UPI002FCC9456
MKQSRFRILAAAAATLFATAAAAADTATLNVTAEVKGVCKFSGAPFSMSITSPSLAHLDPTLTSDGTGTATVSYQCTKNTAPTLKVGGTTTSPYTASGTDRLVSSGNYIPFQIAWGALSAGAGFNQAASTIDLTGTIANANYIDAPVGTYTASVALEITP